MAACNVRMRQLAHRATNPSNPGICKAHLWYPRHVQSIASATSALTRQPPVSNPRCMHHSAQSATPMITILPPAVQPLTQPCAQLHTPDSNGRLSPAKPLTPHPMPYPQPLPGPLWPWNPMARVLGANDGLVSVASLMMGIGGANDGGCNQESSIHITIMCIYISHYI